MKTFSVVGCIVVGAIAAATVLSADKDPSPATPPAAPAAAEATPGPVLAIWESASRFLEEDGSLFRCDVEIWADGRVLWQRREPGREKAHFYLTARIDPKKVQEALDRCERDKFLEPGAFERRHYGPDASFTSIWIQTAEHRMLLESWHENYESNGKVVAMSHGLTGLDPGQTLEEALSKEKDKSYLRFRAVWADLRKEIAALIPKEGERFNGPVAPFRPPRDAVEKAKTAPETKAKGSGAKSKPKR